MYGDIDYDNICERMQLAQVSRKGQRDGGLGVTRAGC